MTPTPIPPDPALQHDVRAVLGLPPQRGRPLLAPLARDVLSGAYGEAPRARLARLLTPRGRPWRRRPDASAVRAEVDAVSPDRLEAVLRELAELW